MPFADYRGFTSTTSIKLHLLTSSPRILLQNKSESVHAPANDKRKVGAVKEPDHARGEKRNVMDQDQNWT
jgi:hypothetical protein